MDGQTTNPVRAIPFLRCPPGVKVSVVRALGPPICALAFAALLSAQSELPKDVLQLAQLKRSVGAGLRMLGNYTCVETIERSQRKHAGQRFQSLDTVHMEAAVVNDRELYSWPGADEFADRDTGELVGAGLMSSGSFASAIRTVLNNNVSTIKWRGDAEIRGRSAVRWDYTIPYNLSRWTIHFDGRGGRLSESGSIWADAETLDLVRLETIANDIPPDLRVLGIRRTIDYARMRVRSQELLLPQSAEVLLTRLNGIELRNRTEFSQCREFAAESSVTFVAPAALDKPLSPVTEFQVPAGLTLSVRMAQAVDSKSSAVGDSLTAALVEPVSYRGAVLIPRGAILRGRIRQLERPDGPRPHYLVGLEFTDIEFAGHRARFTGEMIGYQPGVGISWLLRTSQVVTRDAGVAGSLTASRVDTEIPVQLPGVSNFFIEGTAFRIPEGMQMTWRTTQLSK